MQDQQLTTGAKVGYFALGLFLAVIGILITWLVNRDKPYMGQAIKMSVIGFVVEIVLTCVCYGILMALGIGLYGIGAM